MELSIELEAPILDRGQKFFRFWYFAIIDHIRYNSEKWKKFEIRFTGKTTLFWRNFQTLKARTARATLSSNVHQVCTPKSNNFLSDTTVTRISFFLEILMLYEVYTVHILGESFPFNHRQSNKNIRETHILYLLWVWEKVRIVVFANVWVFPSIWGNIRIIVSIVKVFLTVSNSQTPFPYDCRESLLLDINFPLKRNYTYRILLIV